MDITAKEEQAKYRAVWAMPAYRPGNPGLKSAARAWDALKPKPGETLTEYGCGNGRASLWFADHGLDVTMVDLADNAPDQECRDRLPFIVACLWDMPERVRPSDWAFCADVMEHIPRDVVPATLEAIARHADRTVFKIAHVPAVMNFGEENLHRTVEPPVWWIDQMVMVRPSWTIQTDRPMNRAGYEDSVIVRRRG